MKKLIMKLNTGAKTFLGLAAGMLMALAAYAQSVNVSATSLTANTVANVLAGRYVVDEVYFVNGNSSNAATIKFYDAATAITNVVRPAYTSIGGYSTNYSVVSTNAAGILQTNTFTGWYTYEISNSAVTNERVKLASVVVPAGASRALPLKFLVSSGLTVLSDTAGTIEVTYKGQ